MVNIMKSNRKSLLLLGAALSVAVGAVDDREARACNMNQGLDYWGGYIDAYDRIDNVIFVFWGYGTYGDPQSFQLAANAIFNNNSPLDSLGIGATRFYGVPSQYAGIDWNTFLQEQIAPTPDNDVYTDEGGLPAPDSMGNINLTDTDISNEVDFIASGIGLSYDDIYIIFTPPHAPPPVPGACGQHLITGHDNIGMWITYPDLPACDPTYVQGAVTHEIAEAVTDPAWALGVDSQGWDQGSDGTCEIGDLCILQRHSVQVQPANDPNSEVGTQQEFSNEAVAAGFSGCIYGRSTAATLFGLGSDGNLYATAVAAGSSLSISAAVNWGKPSGVTLTGTPGATSWGIGRLDAFVRSTSGKIYHAASDNSGGTVAWELLNSNTNFSQSPDAVTWGGGNLQVFGVQGTKIVKNTKDYGGSWSGWTTVSGPSGVTPSSKVTVASWASSNIVASYFPTNVRTVVAAFRGSDNMVWLGNSLSGGSFTWKKFSRPATLTGDLDLSAWAPPRLDLFVLDTSGNFWDMFSTDGLTIAGSSMWPHPNAGTFRVGAGAAGLGDGRLIVGGQVGTTSWVQLYNWQGTSWVNAAGSPFVSGFDIASP
jgi:hypothetical protein